jgi:tetratricopeptide (TPR) repeat protein
MQIYRFRYQILTLFILTALCLFAVPEKAGAGEGDREKLFGFAEALFTEGDYYRAITEYKRFKYLYPVDILVEKSNYRIGECTFKAKRWAEAIDALNAFIRQYPAGALRPDALYLKGQAEKEQKRYSDALATFDELIRTKSAPYLDRALYARALVLVAQEDWQKARETFAILPLESPLYPSANLYAQGLGHMDDIPHKSPAWAGALAAILPGAGHLYTERPRDALVAFLLNGSFIWAAVELFHNNNNVAGGIVAFFELGWYDGFFVGILMTADRLIHEMDEMALAPAVTVQGETRFSDPVSANDFWWSSPGRLDK